jgi:hypothetical protein
MWWTRAAVTSKGEELHVNILTDRIPNNAITTWRRSAIPNKRRGNPTMKQVNVVMPSPYSTKDEMASEENV